MTSPSRPVAVPSPPRPVREGLADAEASLSRLAPRRRRTRKVAVTIGACLLLSAAVLYFTPWQQSVVGNGAVGVFSVMDRPQSVDAQIGGRLVAWRIQEGQRVQKGDVLARIEDTEARFLSAERERRVAEQLRAQEARRERTRQRLAQLQAQLAALERSRQAQIPAAEQRRGQARNRLSIARQNLEVAQKNVEAVEQVARVQARERLRQASLRVLQAKDRLAQAEETVKNDAFALKIQEVQRARIGRLYGQGLRSGRDDELEESRLVAARTKLAQSRQAREIAARDIESARAEAEVIRRTGIQADIDVQRAAAQVLAAREALAGAMRDIAIFDLERERIASDTSAALSRERAGIEQVQESLAAIEAAIAAARLEQENLRQRTLQQVVRAPCTGRIARVGKAVGIGQTVKKDDRLVEIVPDTPDQAVELTLSGADAPLVTTGRKVRLQFNGFPAIQVSGFPQAAVGTFAGVVVAMDPSDDGAGRVRLWVRPDDQAIASGREKPWPAATRLRPGTDTIGWVLLERVPLWYELWRQFNAFPPEYRDTRAGAEKGEKASRLLKDGDIKLPKR